MAWRRHNTAWSDTKNKRKTAKTAPKRDELVCWGSPLRGSPYRLCYGHARHWHRQKWEDLPEVWREFRLECGELARERDEHAGGAR